MRNSDDAKLIAGAIEKAGRLISDAIKENTWATMQRTPRYQIPERVNDQIIMREMSGAFHEVPPAHGMGRALPTGTHEE